MYFFVFGYLGSIVINTWDTIYNQSQNGGKKINGFFMSSVWNLFFFVYKKCMEEKYEC